jgi:hypothetical protein
MYLKKEDFESNKNANNKVDISYNLGRGEGSGIELLNASKIY